MKKENGNRGTGFYVINWSEYNPDTGYLDGGTLTNIFSTKKKAKCAVMKLIKDAVRDDMDCYDKDDYMSVYGAKELDEIVDKFVVECGSGLMRTINPNNGIETVYVLTKYSTAYIK